MISIVLTIHNKDFLIEKVVKSIIKNTISDFELIVIFDGCTDKSEIIFDSIDKYIPFQKIHLPNVFETISNNVGMKASSGEFIVIIQDDMIINEYGWDKRLIKPFEFEDVFAVTARATHNYGPREREKEFEKITDYVDKKNAERDIFYIRNSVNRGPLAFRKDMLKKLDFLDEIYAPYTWDDHDICYRAYEKYKWVSGLYVTDYISEPSWGSTRNESFKIFQKINYRNANTFYDRHHDIIYNKNHNEERKIN